jgi:tetratricopeptide (TPR) repeat protein
LRFNPSDLGAFYNRGLVYAQEGDYDRAIQDYNQALLINPKLAVGFRFRGIAYAHKDAYLRAIADWGRWLWLRLGPLGIAIRLFILTLTIGLGFWLKHFDKK